MRTTGTGVKTVVGAGQRSVPAWISRAQPTSLYSRSVPTLDSAVKLWADDSARAIDWRTSGRHALARRCARRPVCRLKNATRWADRVTRQRRAHGVGGLGNFKVTAPEFETVRARLPRLVSPLRPVVTQWDRLSRAWCYMMILAGPGKDRADLRPVAPDPAVLAGDGDEPAADRWPFLGLGASR